MTASNKQIEESLICVISGFRHGVKGTALFWNVTQRRSVVFIEVLGQAGGPIF